MDREAFKIVKMALDIAKAKVEAMKRAITPDQCISSWHEFLGAQHRVFARLKFVTMKDASKGWFDQVTNEQRSDDLLKYLLHARDQHEHGGREVIQYRPQTTVFTMDPNTWGPTALTPVLTAPAHIRIVPVTDRSTQYLLPKSHLGKPIDKNDPITIAILAIAYLESKVAELEARFVR